MFALIPQAVGFRDLGSPSRCGSGSSSLHPDVQTPSARFSHSPTPSAAQREVIRPRPLDLLFGTAGTYRSVPERFNGLYS